MTPSLNSLFLHILHLFWKANTEMLSDTPSLQKRKKSHFALTAQFFGHNLKKCDAPISLAYLPQECPPLLLACFLPNYQNPNKKYHKIIQTVLDDEMWKKNEWRHRWNIQYLKYHQSDVKKQQTLDFPFFRRKLIQELLDCNNGKIL